MKKTLITSTMTTLVMVVILTACSQRGNESQPSGSTTEREDANVAGANAALTAQQVKVSLEQVGALSYVAIDDSLVIRVRVTNNGPVPLPASGNNNVLLGGVQLTKGPSGNFDVRAREYRSPLPANLEPMASIELDLRVPASDVIEGALKIGLVQENVAWFGEEFGQPTLSVGPLIKCAGTNDLCMPSGEPLIKL